MPIASISTVKHMLLFAVAAGGNQYEEAAKKMCSKSTHNKNCQYLAGQVQVSTVYGLLKEG